MRIRTAKVPLSGAAELVVGVHTQNGACGALLWVSGGVVGPLVVVPVDGGAP